MADDTRDGEQAVKSAIVLQLNQKGKAPSKSRGRPPKAGGGKTGKGNRPTVTALPPKGPVRALGVYGNKCYFLDAHNQLREVAARDLSRSVILHLFGSEVGEIYRNWPVVRQNPGTKEWTVTGWDGTKAQEALMHACADAGVWRPQDHVRGRGAWAEGERLIVHSGRRLFHSDGTSSAPGLIGDTVYPAAPPSIKPSGDTGKDEGRQAAHDVLKLMETWEFAREVDARLLLGWIVSSMMAGALKVRPLVWVTGEKGTGKSALVGQDGLIHKLFGNGILMTANSTAAGLYQKIAFDCLPVAIDEIEAKRGNQKTEAVIELARQAYSGGMVLRGGQDHDGKEFRAMSPVLFGSILIPPLMPQDLSRLALLNLKPFADDAVEPVLDADELGQMGERIMRRVLEMWPVWKPRLKAWHDHLRDMGHSGRAADQFGTLLAAADLALCDDVPDEDEMRIIAGSMAPSELQETQVEESNAARCVGFAMSRPLTSMRGGEHMMVSELVACAIRRFGGNMENPVKPLDAIRYLERAGVTVVVARFYARPPADNSVSYTLTKANKANPADLEKQLDAPENDQDNGVFVAFAPNGDGILELFRGSDWEGVAGAHNPYTQALERVTGAQRAPITVRIGGMTCRPILIPIRECIDVASKEESKPQN